MRSPGLGELSDEEQDLAAELLMQVGHRHAANYHLTPEQVEEVRHTQEGLRNGTVRLLTEEEVEEMWRRLGA
jgi:hypothetical protein